MEFIVVIAIILLLVIILAAIIRVVNKVNKLKIKIEESHSSIEIALVKRYDVIKQSFECAKGYAAHEKEIFSKLIEVRKGMSVEQLQQVAETQNRALTSLRATMEAYPNLKADSLFSNLQNQLAVENEHFAASKRVYNSNVSVYNQYVVAFPVCVIASMVGGTKKDFFKEEDLENKRNISFDF